MATKCTSCNGKYLVNSQCLANCPNTSYPDTVNLKCLPCVAPCATCTSSTACVTCISSGPTPYLVGSTCAASCTDGTTNVNNVC